MTPIANNYHIRTSFQGELKSSTLGNIFNEILKKKSLKGCLDLWFIQGWIASIL